jgi:DNA-binding transcriptional ArsR family regulator
MSEESLDLLLRALSDANRRGLLDRLRDHPGLTLGELSAGFSFSRQALSKHLAMLEGAELVVTIWRGREKLHYLNPQPLRALPSRWVTTTTREHSAAMTTLQLALEAAAPPAGDAIAELLAAKPPPATRVRDEAALSIACAYLEGTAQAVRAL